MFIQVRLLKGFQKPLIYKIPNDWQQTGLVGKVVRVPIRSNVVPAVVIQEYNQAPDHHSFTIKTAESIEPFPDDSHYHHFIKQLSFYYQVDEIHFIKRIRQFIIKQEKTSTNTIALDHEAKQYTNNITLTKEQQKVFDFLSLHIKQPAYTPTVLHGVTGSGKTEVYKQLIIEAMQHHKSALLLLPEVTLAIQFEKLMREQLPPSLTICGFHSATGIKHKRVLWQYLLHKQPVLIIGVHLPVLLPLANLGLIIVDEEHEGGYQEKKHPKVNTKEAAIWRAQLNNIPILLGSATPSLSSLYNTKTKGWHFFQLQQRFAGNFPTIKTVLLTDKKQRRRNFWISKQLEDAIKDRLHKQEQIIIFLNRRGFSFFVQCKLCSFVFTCSTCSVSLTLHQDNTLTCHYCNFSMQQPTICTQCSADKHNLLKKGIGTQQVVSILQQLFPAARIGRADLDTTTKKKVWQQIMHDFESGMLDILVGTQTITKGFHFPRVTLVGILWADLNLHFPIYNATETTLQQLLQVAGRAGRQSEHSLVIVQAMVQHPIFNYLNEINYLTFYTHELRARKEVGYPPCKRLVEIELKHTDEAILDQEAHNIVYLLSNKQKQHNFDIQILGPAKPLVYKIKNVHTRKIYLKGNNIKEIIALFQMIKQSQYTSKLFFTPNPMH